MVKNFITSVKHVYNYELPLTEITRSGIEFYPVSMNWTFRDELKNVNMNFSTLPQLESGFLISFQRVLIWYLKNRAARTANNYFDHFKWLIKQLHGVDEGPINQISSENIAAVMLLSDSAEYRVGNISGFLQKWFELGIPGINQDVVDLLISYRPRKYPTGLAVATLDPFKGPLTDYEFESAQKTLIEAYTAKKIDRELLTLCYLIMALGVRPIQIASLKYCDLIWPETSDGDYYLKVPRAKQLNQFARTTFKTRRLSPHIGKLLAKHLDDLNLEYINLFPEMENFPMFPQKTRVERDYAPGFEFHVTAIAITSRVVNCFSRLKVNSERLSEPMPLNAIRLRRTFATRATEEGWPLMVIAEMMDHSTTSTVEVYSGITPRVRANFSKKIAMDMAPLAMAFAGRILEKEDEASRPFPTSRIVDLRIDQSGNAMGSCGNFSHCEFARPIACYSGCMDFEPWLDGPHEEALDYMLTRREALLETTDLRIASINDRAILGCAQIVLRCRQIKENIKNDC